MSSMTDNLITTWLALHTDRCESFKQALDRLNAELGTSYNIPKLVDWCFTTAGNVRNWGAIVGNWGGYD